MQSKLDANLTFNWKKEEKLKTMLVDNFWWKFLDEKIMLEANVKITKVQCES